jgi:hypothetical protein
MRTKHGDGQAHFRMERSNRIYPKILHCHLSNVTAAQFGKHQTADKAEASHDARPSSTVSKDKIGQNVTHFPRKSN